MHGANVAAQAPFAADVREYLLRTPRQLPSRYFYDALGSALFNAICELPWYRITRAESALLARHGREILRPLRRPVGLAELGCGNGDKLALLAVAADEVHRPGVPEDRAPLGLVQLVDISRAALDTAVDRLRAIGLPAIFPHHATYEAGLSLIARHRSGDGALLVLFLGSNIGNFDPPADLVLLRQIRAVLRPGDALLLGSDLVKPESELLAAYDDPLQVTAAFNRNLLRRINDELDGNFELDRFAHRAVWNADAGRVEMHLVSLAAQTVRVAKAGLELALDAGEWIWTESSYKYDPATVRASGVAAGFAVATQWIDPDAHFALTRFDVSPARSRQ